MDRRKTIVPNTDDTFYDFPYIYLMTDQIKEEFLILIFLATLPVNRVATRLRRQKPVGLPVYVGYVGECRHMRTRKCAYVYVCVDRVPWV